MYLFVTILLLFYFFSKDQGIIKANFPLRRIFSFLIYRHTLAPDFQVQCKPYPTLTVLDKFEDQLLLDHPSGQFLFLISFSL